VAAGDFLRAHLELDAADLRTPTADQRRLFAQGVASYALSCKTRWQGLVSGSFYYRAGQRAWPPGESSPFGDGDGTSGFFSPEGRVGALALHELLTYGIAQRTPERCAIEVADEPHFTALGLRGAGAAGVLLASLAPTARLVRVAFDGGPALSVARVVSMDTDAEALVEQEVPLARAVDGSLLVEVTLGPLQAAVIELE